MSDEIKISYEFVNEKLQQIHEAKKAFHELVCSYGQQNRIFQDGDLVKLSRNGRKHKICRADFGYGAFSDDFRLVVEYMIEPVTHNSNQRIRVRESEIESC